MGDESPGVIDPDELGVLEVLRQAPSVFGRHRPVLARPHHQHLALERPLLLVDVGHFDLMDLGTSQEPQP